MLVFFTHLANNFYYKYEQKTYFGVLKHEAYPI